MKTQELTIFSKLVQISLRGVIKNWRQSLAAILSVTAGFFASALFQGYIDHAALQFDLGFTQQGMLGHILIQKKGAQTESKRDPWKYSLTASDQAEIDAYLDSRSKELAEKVKFLTFQGLITNGRFTTVFLALAYDIQEGARLRGSLWKWDAELGVPLYSTQEPNAITTGRALSELLSCEPVDKNLPHFDTGGGYLAEERAFKCKYPTFQLSTTTEGSQVNAIEGQLVGIVDSGMREIDRQYVQMPLPLAQKLAGTQSVSYYAITLKNRAQALKLAHELEDHLNKKGLSIEAHPWTVDKRGELFRQGMSVLSLFRVFILLIVAVVASMSIANTVITSIAQRTREIGTLRSMGYRQRHILILFTLEGFFIALMGSFIGVALSISASLLITNAHFSYYSGLFTQPVPLSVAIVFHNYFTTLVVLCTVAVISSLFVSRQASKLQITEALSHV